ncbi:hypothetical protein ACJX0J_009549, partial [Zea mays]
MRAVGDVIDLSHLSYAGIYARKSLAPCLCLSTFKFNSNSSNTTTSFICRDMNKALGLNHRNSNTAFVWGNFFYFLLIRDKVEDKMP